MARSSYIYILEHMGTGKMIAGFTVKWEMEDWIERQQLDPDVLKVYRLKDGRFAIKKEAVEIEI